MPYDVLSFHPGRQHNFEQAAQLCRHFKNFKHVTSLYFEQKTIRRIEHIYPKMASFLKKRTSVMSGSVVDTKSRYAIKLHVKQKLFGNDSIGLIDYYKKNAAFQKWLIGHYAPPKV